MEKETKALINNPRMAGKNIKMLLWFLDESKKEKSVVIATKVGNILSPKAVENLKQEYIDAINLILPLAKGYVAKNDVGSNQKYIDIAEKLITPLKED